MEVRILSAALLEPAVHDRATVAEALRLRDEEGLGARRVARRLGLPLGTVRDWHAERLPLRARRGADQPCCEACGQDKHRFDELGADYVHLLGLYLGDGCISKHPRGVYRLRIFLDKKASFPTNEAAAVSIYVSRKDDVARLDEFVGAKR
ncbi:MAG TPA: hypothetical protein VFG58_04070 [Solirubrobacterales bacterium]|nr:hypothetical protein [Solirubrobacterales bacterium]